MNLGVSRTNRMRRHIWLAGAAVACMLAATPAIAQEQRTFDVPAQDAASAVQEIARQSGLQVMAPNTDLRSVRTNAVQGRYRPVEAVERLIAGTGLEVVQTSENTVTIRRASAVMGSSLQGSSELQEDEPAGVDAAEYVAEEPIVITGSRIERAGFDTLQAAIVNDEVEIERRGYINIAEALEANPLFGLSDDGLGNNQDVNNTGQRFVNLFNLGSQRTLTLVNGRRFVSGNSAAAGASPGAQVDLNLIPTSLIARVETIAIGGAPIYGSDAIAGTVNIILKDDFDGVEFSGLSQINEDGDAYQYALRALAGTNFSEDRGNIVASVEYTEQDGFIYSDRFGTFKSLLPNPGDVTDTDGFSALRVVDDLRFPIFTDGGLPYFDSGATAVIGFDSPGLALPAFGIAPDGNYIFDADGRPLQFAPGGNLVPFDVGVPVEDLLESAGLGAFGTLPLQSAGGDGFSLGNNASLLTPTKRLLGNILAHYDITPDVRVFFEGAYAHSNAVRLSDLTSFSVPGLLGGAPITLSVDNPFLTSQARGILVANGLTTFNLNRNLNDIVQRRPQRTRQDLYRFVGGFEGAFDVGDESWNWDIAYNYGQIRNHSEITYVNTERFLAAINAVSGPGGDIVCGGAAPAGCVPLNLFGLGAPSDAAVAYVIDEGNSKSVNTQQVFTANVGGRLPFGIGADPLAFNIGVERREEKATFDANTVLEGGDVFVGGAAGAFSDVRGKFNTKEIYGELVVPLVSSGQDFALIREAQLEGAIRYVDHSIAGGATTWSVGGRLSPRLGGIGDGLTLRGVYTRAIRAPAITELFLGQSPVTSGIFDPCDTLNFDEGLNPAVREANCAAALAAVGAPAPPAFVQTTDLRSVSGIVAGNPDLDNEKAKSWSAGFVYQPPAIPNLRLAADWTDIKLTGGIETLGINFILPACYDSTQFPDTPACANFRRLSAADIAAGNGTGGITRNVGDIAEGFQSGFVNTSSTHFAGLIVAGAYSFALDGVAESEGGALMRFGTTVFYTDQFTAVAFAGDPTEEAGGTVGQPTWRVQGNAGVTIGAVDFDVQVLWRDKTKFNLESTIEDTPVNDVGSYTLVNGTVGWRIDDRFKFQFIVNNVFDRDVPFSALVNRSFGGFDILGRSYTVTAAVSF